MYRLISLFIAGVLFASCGRDISSDRPQVNAQKPKDCSMKQLALGTGTFSLKKSIASDSEKGWFEASFMFTEGPFAGKYSCGYLSLTTRDGMELKDVKLVPYMKVHNHGTGKVQPILKKSDEANLFLANNIFFIMSGPWELNAYARVKGKKDHAEIKVEVPQ